MWEQIRNSFEQIHYFFIQIRQVSLGLFGRRIWMKLWRKWMPVDEIVVAVSCSATVTDKFELQVTKTGAKVQNWKHIF